MKRIILGITVLLSAQLTFGQNEDDALRYSETFFGGTARNTSMAGAMTAIGGDFSVVTQNPAGLARLRKTNFSATLNVENNTSNTDFYGVNTTDRGTIGNIGNLSYVKVYNLDPKKFNNWYGVQLGMGISRIKSFQQRINYTGVADSSILHSFSNEAFGTPDSLIYDYHPFTSGLAYEVYAIDPIGGNQYQPGFTSGKAIHDRSITRRGGMNEYSFSLSANYANKLYIGGSFNMTKVNYEETFQHRETYTDTSLWLQSINYTGTLDIEGWGYSLRVGAIYLATDWLSIGVGAQLPTVYNLSDSWSNNMSSQTDDGPRLTDPAFLPTGSYDYRVTTPFKANLSLGAVLSDFGSIGVEVEYVDHSSSVLKDRNFNSAPYGFVGENFQIENIYQSVVNYKIGGEARLSTQAYARAGFAFYDSPFAPNKGNSQYKTLFYTGGLGYNWGNVFTDVAVVLRSSKADYYAYDPSINGSKSTTTQNNLMFKFSLGLRM